MTTLTAVQPMLQEQVVPSNQPHKFAFLIHFRFGFRQDLGLYWKPFRALPDNLYQFIFPKFKTPAAKWSHIETTDSRGNTMELGRNEVLLLSSELMLEMGPKEVFRYIDSTVDMLVEKGYKTIGLGALTSPLTLGGKMLASRKDVSITNGNAYTAVSLLNGAVRLMENRADLIDHHTILGASGSVGSCLAKLLVKRNYVGVLQLIARNKAKLDKLAKELKAINPNAKIQVSTNIEDIKKSNLVTLLTASADNLIAPHYLKENAVIFDGTQPRNTSPELLKYRPDVQVIDGGIVHIPGIQMHKGGFGLPPECYYACFSETVLLALEGYKEHFAIGNPSLEQAEYIDSLAKKYSSLGFQLADYTSFGKPSTFHS